MRAVKKIAVLADMKELGEQSVELHKTHDYELVT